MHFWSLEKNCFWKIPLQRFGNVIGYKHCQCILKGKTQPRITVNLLLRGVWINLTPLGSNLQLLTNLIANYSRVFVLACFVMSAINQICCKRHCFFSIRKCSIVTFLTNFLLISRSLASTVISYIRTGRMKHYKVHLR